MVDDDDEVAIVQECKGGRGRDLPSNPSIAKTKTVLRPFCISAQPLLRLNRCQVAHWRDYWRCLLPGLTLAELHGWGAVVEREQPSSPEVSASFPPAYASLELIGMPRVPSPQAACVVADKGSSAIASRIEFVLDSRLPPAYEP